MFSRVRISYFGCSLSCSWPCVCEYYQPNIVAVVNIKRFEVDAKRTPVIVSIFHELYDITTTLTKMEVSSRFVQQNGHHRSLSCLTPAHQHTHKRTNLYQLPADIRLDREPSRGSLPSTSDTRNNRQRFSRATSLFRVSLLGKKSHQYQPLPERLHNAA